MIDFTPLEEQDLSLQEFAQRFSVADLRRETNEMIDTMLALIDDCVDEDVIFVPTDPDAFDHFTTLEEEVEMSWTLGHVIVHTTASAEESAALATELARGVAFHGRSRYEVPWRTMRTVAQCRERLEESRRLRLASLEMWPDLPHLDNTYTPIETLGPLGPLERFLLGLSHDSSHLKQIEEIMRQAKGARGG